MSNPADLPAALNNTVVIMTIITTLVMVIIFALVWVEKVKMEWFGVAFVAMVIISIVVVIIVGAVNHISLSEIFRALDEMFKSSKRGREF